MILTLTLFIASCSSDDGSVFDTIPDPNPTDDTPAVATLIFSEENSSSNVVVAEASGEAGKNSSRSNYLYFNQHNTT